MTSSQSKSAQELKDSPHWRVELQPSPYDGSRFETLGDAREFVESRRVRLRGWAFPSFSFDEKDWECGQDYWGSRNSHRSVSEYWRFYQSGQFVHLCDIREVADKDWFRELSSGMERQLGDQQNNIPGCLDFVNLVWTITEHFEFAARAATSGRYGSTVKISIALKNVKGFYLVSGARRPIGGPFQTAAPDLEWSKSIATSDLASGSRLWTCQCSVFFIERFGWLGPSPEVIGGLRDELYPSPE